jgi:predicted helicase
MNSFDEIYILDLHGNALKREKAPDGSKDENVFDIQQGVAIALFVKHKERSGECKVFHQDLWGLRDLKYESLRTHHFKAVMNTKLHPSSPYYFFVPKKETHRRSYEQLPLLTDLFTVSVNGIVTARDRFVIDFSRRPLHQRMSMFRDLSIDDDFIKASFNLKENYMWRVTAARKELAGVEDWQDRFSQILYRPFDVREIYYHPSVVWRSRAEVMRHLLQPNVCLVCPKRLEMNIPWSHVFVSDKMIDHVSVSLKTVDYCFPLYLYPDTNKYDLFSPYESGRREPNILSTLLEALTSAHKRRPEPEEVFNYVYAVLYSEAYRRKYVEFLKTDFPRIPFTKDGSLFRSVAEWGARLVDLHLLKSDKLANPIPKCEGSGNMTVVRVSYDPKNARVHVNPDKYFTGVALKTWEYRVGAYQVAEKWLKDRKGRVLSSEEVATYLKIITALAETMKIQEPLDGLFNNVESSLLKVTL